MNTITLSIKEDAFSEYWQQREFYVFDKEGKRVTTVATKDDRESVFEIEELNPNFTSFFAQFCGYQDKANKAQQLKAQAIDAIREKIRLGEHSFTITLNH